MKDKTVLVIDDDDMNLKLVEAILVYFKYCVLTANHAELGLKLARDHKPDLILMDIQMPGLDGLSATRQLKNDPEMAGIPVVALTGFAMEGDEEKAIDAGCVGYITKPIDTRRFIDTITTYFVNGEDIEEPKYQFHDSRIIFVNQDANEQKLVESICSDSNYEILHVPDIQDVVQKAAESDPDLIIIDQNIFIHGGPEIMKNLKSDPHTHVIPVLLALTESEPEDSGQLYDTVVDDLIFKPFQPIILLTRIKSLVKLKHCREQIALHNRAGSKINSGRESIDQGQSVYSIILLNSEEQNFKRIREIMEDEPCKIDVVKDIGEAIEFMKSEKQDIMIIDTLSGLEKYRDYSQQLKTMYNAKDLQILYIVKPEELDRKQRFPGPEEYILTPVDFSELRIRIKTLLEKKILIDSLNAHHEKILESSLKDEVTGLDNPIYFKKFLDMELKRSKRQRSTMALTLIGLNEAEQYFENLGDVAVDILLGELAKLLKNNVREVDLLSRFGPEKFALLQPYTNKENMQTILDRIQNVIKNHQFCTDASLGASKISLSTATIFAPNKGQSSTAEEILNEAAMMLFQSK